MRRWMALLAATLLVPPAAGAADRPADPAAVHIDPAQAIPLRDGVVLGAVLYRNKAVTGPAPCVVTMTPYTADTYHDRGVYFATQGLPFLIVDVRGRGNSGGVFKANRQEVGDAHDVVEWAARQPWCNGKVGMWGGSYAGFAQWAAAKTRPPHLATIVPAAASYPGLDFPWRNNIGNQYVLQWLRFVGGHASQAKLFYDQAFWTAIWRDRFVRGEPFASLPQQLGGDEPLLREWLAHPEQDAWFDAQVPGPDDYRAMDLPVLTITGIYDDDQPGALAYHRNAMRFGRLSFTARQYLIIGPWDHAGTRTPQQQLGGLHFGPASLVDLPALHTQWYRWTMAAGPRPTLLQKPVAYYVTGAEVWRHADSLAAITARRVPWHLGSQGDAAHLASPGVMTQVITRGRDTDRYVYDPRDTATADLESQIDPGDPTETRLLLARDGKQLVYETPAFALSTEIAGFFKLDAWIAIDQRDTDFHVAIYETMPDGKRILLTTDILRARYRQSLRVGRPITTTEPQLYTFDNFTFTARRIATGNRLQLVVGPINTIYTQKNYNSGGPIVAETMADARTVSVRLFHDRRHRSVLHIPFGEGV
jgi:uncharacterized protein